MKEIALWMRDNPGLATAVVWPFVLALFTVAFKSRSAESYAALAARHPVWFFVRLAAFLQLLGAIGIDPLKATQVASKVVMGTVWVPPPSSEHVSVKPPHSGPAVSDTDEDPPEK